MSFDAHRPCQFFDRLCPETKAVYGKFTHFRDYYTVFSPEESLISKSVILCILTIKVEALCSSADVVGGKIPITPSAIKLALKDMINR